MNIILVIMMIVVQQIIGIRQQEKQYLFQLNQVKL